MLVAATLATATLAGSSFFGPIAAISGVYIYTGVLFWEIFGNRG